MTSSGQPPDTHDGGRWGIHDMPLWLSSLAVAAILGVVAAAVWLVIPRRPGDLTDAATSPVVTGEAVSRVLLDGTTLTEMLGQPFEKADRPARMPGSDDDNEPAGGDCVGVVNVAPQSVYASADMRGFAHETWRDATPGTVSSYEFQTKVMFVDEAVIALPSAAAAKNLFAKFTDQWRRCDGKAVNPDSEADGAGSERVPHLPGTDTHITGVRVNDTVLAASIVLDQNPQVPDTRAVGVRGNCIVEVLIAFTGAEHGSGSADPETSATEVARAMMDKVDTLG